MAAVLAVLALLEEMVALVVAAVLIVILQGQHQGNLEEAQFQGKVTQAVTENITGLH